MSVPEEEIRRRVAHMREEREHVDFMEKTAALIAKRLDRGVTADQRGNMGTSVQVLLEANRALREAAGTPPDAGEIAAEAALEALLTRLR